jgi:peptide/nickel transport system substrate-binding protein
MVTLPLLAVLMAVGTTGGGASAAGPRGGGTLTFAVGSDAGCVDAQQASSNDGIYSMRQTVDSLTDQDPSTGAIVPWLARSWEASADAKTFTFHLRGGATFSDGSPVDAQAVKDNFDTIPTLGSRAHLGIGFLTGYAGSRVVDPSTVEVSFQQPNAQFLQATSTAALGLVSSASTRKTADERCAQGVAGSGPFTLEAYTPGQRIELVRRDGYRWGSSLWRKPGAAYLKRLVFTVVPDAATRTNSLISGQVDAIGSVGRADEAALAASGVVNLRTRANPGIVFYLGLNATRPIAQSPAVRQALLLAIDRPTIADTVYPTGSLPATSVLARTTPYHSDLSAKVNLDPTRAKALLDAEGWLPGTDGIRVKNGSRLAFTVTYFANAATNQPTLELVKQNLAAVGVDLTLLLLPFSELARVQTTGDFDALFGNSTRADPDILRGNFSTASANYYRLPAGPLDQVLTDQAGEVDPAARQALVAEAQNLIVDAAFIIPVAELTTELGVAKPVRDLHFDSASRIQLHDTWKR